jgi:hypothetical protein
MLLRTHRIAAAAILAAAIYVPVHIFAEQGEGQGRQPGDNANSGSAAPSI